MSCASLISCLTNALERLGLYAPKISLQEASTRLEKESGSWKKNVHDRSAFWKKYYQDRATHPIDNVLPALVGQGLSRLHEKEIQKGVAVDLGCGISSTTNVLLHRGWKVHAVDDSSFVIGTLSTLQINWIQRKQLVLIKGSIERFEYLEKAHLITAIDSLCYCNPLEIQNIFFKAKHALLSGGVFVYTLVAHNTETQRSGSWMTTKNVVEAVMRSMKFTSWSISKKSSPEGCAKLFYVLAQK